MTALPADPVRPARALRLPRAQRRLQLLGCARAVFASQGYAGTSMDQIAERAGVSKPVLYQHFPSKHELFLELLDAEVAELTERLTQAMTAPQEHRGRVHSTVHAVFAYLDSPEREHRIVFDSGAELDPAVRDRVESVHQAIACQVSLIIAESTRVRPADAEVLSRGIVAYVLGAARHWADRMSGEERGTAAQTAEVVDALLWSGLSCLPRDADG